MGPMCKDINYDVYEYIIYKGIQYIYNNHVKTQNLSSNGRIDDKSNIEAKMGSDLKYIHKLVLHNTHLTSSVEFGHAVIRLNKCRFFFVVVKVLKFMRFKRYITFIPFLFYDFSKIQGHFLDRFKESFQSLYLFLRIESVHIIQLKDVNSPCDHFILTNSLCSFSH